MINIWYWHVFGRISRSSASKVPHYLIPVQVTVKADGENKWRLSCKVANTMNCSVTQVSPEYLSFMSLFMCVLIVTLLHITF